MKVLTLPAVAIVLGFHRHRQELPNMFMRRNCHIRLFRTRPMCSIAALAVALACVSMGCKKHQPEAPPPASPTQAVATASQAAPTASQNLYEITSHVRRCILKNQRPRINFEDFASTTSYQIPPPPHGKKYVINRQMHVVLENR